ncbi:hypothetical protein V5799_015283, partial [Amblyomma americanum]
VPAFLTWVSCGTLAFCADLGHHLHPEQREPNSEGCPPSLGSANHRQVSRRQGAGLHLQLARWTGLQCNYSPKPTRPCGFPFVPDANGPRESRGGLLSCRERARRHKALGPRRCGHSPAGREVPHHVHILAV